MLLEANWGATQAFTHSATCISRHKLNQSILRHAEYLLGKPEHQCPPEVEAYVCYVDMKHTTDVNSDSTLRCILWF